MKEEGFISELEDHGKPEHVLVIHAFRTVLGALVSGQDAFAVQVDVVELPLEDRIASPVDPDRELVHFRGPKQDPIGEADMSKV